MQDFLFQLGKILYPEASDQDINESIQEIKQQMPDQDDQMIALGVIQHFVSGGE
jgi:hypothetical protein